MQQWVCHHLLSSWVLESHLCLPSNAIFNPTEQTKKYSLCQYLQETLSTYWLLKKIHVILCWHVVSIKKLEMFSKILVVKQKANFSHSFTLMLFSSSPHPVLSQKHILSKLTKQCGSFWILIHNIPTHCKRKNYMWLSCKIAGCVFYVNRNTTAIINRMQCREN